MGRRTEGHKVKWKRGWAYARFTHEGIRYDVALRTRDPDEAPRRAAYEYAEVVSGRRRPVARQSRTALDLQELLAVWIDSQKGALDPKTLDTLEVYARHYVGFFASLDRITEAGGGDYGRARLTKVLRKTVLKELSFLRQFLAWCKEQGVLSEVPLIPPLKKKAPGVRSGTQRAKPVDITEEEAHAILERLPVESKRIGERRWPIRARFLFAWETGLRPSSVELLSVPTHWTHGSAELVLEDADDKARFGRTLDLSKTALAVLRAVAPPDGLIFGEHCFDKALKRAAREVLGERRGKSFAAYDFRHGRAQTLVDAGASLRGVAYLLGHKRLSTTDRYLRADRREGQRALAAGEGTDRSRKGTGTGTRNG